MLWKDTSLQKDVCIGVTPTKMRGKSAGIPCTCGLIMPASTQHDHTPSVSPSVSIVRMSGIGDLNSLVHVKTLYLNNSINNTIPPDPRRWTRMPHLTYSMLGNVGSSGWFRQTRVQSLLVQGVKRTAPGTSESLIFCQETK